MPAESQEEIHHIFAVYLPLYFCAPLVSPLVQRHFWGFRCHHLLKDIFGVLGVTTCPKTSIPLDFPNPPWKSNTPFDEVFTGMGIPMGYGNSKEGRDKLVSLEFPDLLGFLGSIGIPRRYWKSKEVWDFQDLLEFPRGGA